MNQIGTVGVSFPGPVSQPLYQSLIKTKVLGQIYEGLPLSVLTSKVSWAQNPMKRRDFNGQNK